MGRFKTGLLAILFFFTGLVAVGASATEFQVTKAEDTNDGLCDSDCSLREAVIAANMSPGADTIQLPAGSYGLSLLGMDENESQTGDLDVKDDLTIVGAGKELSIINGLGEDRVIHVVQLTAESAISLTIQNVTIRNGFTTADPYPSYSQSTGAGVQFFSDGTLTVENSLLTKNHSSYYGGALEVRSFSNSFLVPETILNVSNTVITDNCATSGVAIDGDGHWTITDSTISNNGGWFEPEPEQRAAFDCQVNEAGGGMYLNRVEATIRNTSIVDNEAIGGGGIYFYCCSADITNTTVARNNGYAGKVPYLPNSLGGGGIETYGGVLSIVNSTIVDNISGESGGGIKVYSDLYQPPATVQLVNTILANNSATEMGPDCSGGVTSLGNNLIGDTLDCGFVPDGGATDLYGLPDLGLFVDDGTSGSGYYPPLAGSIVIDAGDNSACPEDDQRGAPRPADGDGDNIANCDIGAYEVVPDTLVVQIDIKPNDATNSVNLSAGGVLPIAILSTPEFNAMDIDTSLNDDGSGKISLSGASAKVKGKSGNSTSASDVDDDGDTDLVIHFHITEIDPALLEVDGTTTYATISGVLYDESPFSGKDSVVIVNR